MAVEYFDWGNDGGPFRPGEDHRNVPWSPPPWNINWSTTNRGYALIALGKFLVWAAQTGLLDYATPEQIKPTPYYGGYKEQAVRAWQEQNELTVDGIVGYNTIKSMCRPLFKRDQDKYDIPLDLACRLCDLESGFYPAAYNTGGDWWLGQQHYPTNGPPPPNPDDRSRFGYNTNLFCKELKEAFDRLKKKYPTNPNQAADLAWDTKLWRAAVMSYNAPAWAPQWLEANFVCEGGGTIHVGNWEGDKFAWCCLYTNAVYARKC